jgi:hypothetical protein
MGWVLSVLQLSGTSAEPFLSYESAQIRPGYFQPIYTNTTGVWNWVGFSVQPTTRHIVISSDMRSLLTAHYYSGLRAVATVTVCSSGTFLLVVVACIPTLKAAWTCLRRPLQDEETKHGVPRNNGS